MCLIDKYKTLILILSKQIFQTLDSKYYFTYYLHSSAPKRWLLIYYRKYCVTVMEHHSNLEKKKKQ